MATLGTLSVNLTANTSQFSRNIQTSTDQLDKFRGHAAAALAAVTATFAASSIKFAEFDDAIRSVQAVTGSAGAEFKSMSDRALELGASTSFTAVEVANLMTELGRAGFRPTEINAMTEAVLNLSRATGTDASMSAGIMAATLRQFNLGATEATRVADVLTATANKTFNTVEQLGEALSYAGPVAADLKIPLEDVAAALGMLGNVGIQGSNAGTALRRLTTITGAEAEKMQTILGVSFLDSAGNVKPLLDNLEALGQSLQGLSTGERLTRLNDAFGILGITGASALANTAGSAKELRDELLKLTGIAEKTAATMDAGLGGALRIAKSAAEGLMIAIGNHLSPSLTFALKAATALLQTLTKYAHVLVPFIAAIAGAASAMLILTTATKAYAKAAAFAQAMSGPKGLTALAVGLAAAAAATYSINAAIKDANESATSWDVTHISESMTKALDDTEKLMKTVGDAPALNLGDAIGSVSKEKQFSGGFNRNSIEAATLVLRASMNGISKEEKQLKELQLIRKAIEESLKKKDTLTIDMQEKV
jgi:TP901 family phage tail tape measure protein